MNAIPGDSVGSSRRLVSQKTLIKNLDGLMRRSDALEEIKNLSRYSQGDIWFPFKSSESPYGFSDAAGYLLQFSVCYAGWHASYAYFTDQIDWFNLWRRKVAYGYWGNRASYRRAVQIKRDFDCGARAKIFGYLSLAQTGINIADCVVLGWTDWAIDLAQRAYSVMDLDPRLFNDAGDGDIKRRTQHFVLRLISNWQGWAARPGPACAYDEPVFNALIDNWKNPDSDRLKPILLSALDRHVAQTANNTKYKYYDCNGWSDIYNPFEVMAVLRLRQTHGLRNPNLGEHALMQTALSRELPPVTEPYSDELLEKVLARARTEVADF